MLRTLAVLLLLVAGCDHEYEPQGISCDGFETVGNNGSGNGSGGGGCGGDCSNISMEWGYNDPQYDSFCATAAMYQCRCMEDARKQTCRTLIQLEIATSNSESFSGICPICSLSDNDQ